MADVPCSGDGTLRKSKPLMNKWSPKFANGLHSTQKEILNRSVQLCEVGGTIVYSTCSMNPVENEAVVLSALRKYRGNLELVDLSQHPVLQNLKFAKGFPEWKVIDNKCNVYECRSQAGTDLPKSAFPSYNENNDFPDDYHLERCIRVYPHLQNTGAFFIAVLRKTSDLPENLDLSISNDRKL